MLVPYSWPRSTRASPTSSNSSVTNGPRPDPGDVRLDDAHHPVDVAGADPRARARAAGHRVGRRDVGIGAVVEVEEGGLGALEQHVLAELERLVGEVDRVGHVGLDPRRQLAEVEVGDLVDRRRQLVVDLGEQLGLVLEHQLELLAEDLGVVHVLHAQADPGGLVGVGRTDAALGGAQLVLAEVALGHPVHQLVVRQDQVGAGGDLEPGAALAPPLEHVDLVEQHLGIDDHAVADHRRDVVVEDARGDELQGEGLAVDDERVPRVVPALVADDQVHLLGEEVGELALALVAPLGSDHDGRRHVALLEVVCGAGRG